MLKQLKDLQTKKPHPDRKLRKRKIFVFVFVFQKQNMSLDREQWPFLEGNHLESGEVKECLHRVREQRVGFFNLAKSGRETE